jgi:hypothetical protein
MFLDLDALSPAAVFLRQAIPDGHTVGTGFFLKHNNILYLVTAEHVEADLGDTAEIIVSDLVSAIPIVLSWQNLNQQAKKTGWIRHPVADLSVLRLNPEPSLLNGALAKRFLPSDLLPTDLRPPSREVILTSLGYPLGLGTQGHISPLSFETRIAGGPITLPRFDNKKPCDFYIMQNPSIGGYSGCPVFDTSIFKAGSMTTRGSGTVLWGITHGTISDRSGGKMAAITPAKLLRDII